HEIHDGDRSSHGRAPRQEQRVEEVVPGQEEREDGGGGQPWRRQGKSDTQEGPRHARPVDIGGLLERGRNAIEEGPPHHGHQREVEGEVDDDEAQARVDEAEVFVEQEERDAEGDGWGHAGSQRPQREETGGADASPRKCVGGWYAKEEGESSG